MTACTALAPATPIQHPHDSDVTEKRSVSGTDVDVLTQFFNDDVNMAIWERSPNPECLTFAQAFAERSGALQGFVSIEPDENAQALLPKWALEIPGAQAWLDDIHTVIDMFRCLFEPSAVGVRLHVLTGTMCPRFHVDRVPARLLVTYAGKGTEWLTEAQVTRTEGQTRLPDQTVPNEAIKVVPTAAVALLKGELWDGNEGYGLVHRSPAPEGTPRVVLALDWLS